MSDVQELLEEVISDPVIEASAPGPSGQAPTAHTTPLIIRLRFLSLKNLAGLLARSDDTAFTALQLYCHALCMEDDRALLWQQMGTLVRILLGLVTLPLWILQCPWHLVLEIKQINCMFFHRQVPLCSLLHLRHQGMHAHPFTFTHCYDPGPFQRHCVCLSAPLYH